MTHPLVAELYSQMSLPVICSPMFIVSNPKMTIAQCVNGVVGSLPALNARPQALLDEWLTEVRAGLAAYEQAQPQARIAPFAVNLIVHQSNDRLHDDLAVCEKHRVPLIITSLRAPNEVIDRVHAWGGKVFHDVVNLRHAEKALEAGVDGLILVCAGAGGHAGVLSPFALLTEVRRIFDGPIALSGAIATGRGILAARAMGADFAYIGTRFIASEEATADPAYKQMIVEASAADILYTPFFTGIHGNYLKPSIVASGLNPVNLPEAEKAGSNFGSSRVKPWKDVWGAGQGVGAIESVLPTARIVQALKTEYHEAQAALAAETRADSFFNPPHVSHERTATP